MGKVLTEAEMWSLLIENCNNREFSNQKANLNLNHRLA